MSEKIEKLKSEIARDETKIEKHLAEAERLKKNNAARRKKLAELESAEILDFIRVNGITFEQLMSLKKDIKSDSETVLQQNFETETAEANSDYFTESNLFDFAVPDDDYGENEEN